MSEAITRYDFDPGLIDWYRQRIADVHPARRGRPTFSCLQMEAVMEHAIQREAAARKAALEEACRAVCSFCADGCSVARDYEDGDSDWCHPCPNTCACGDPHWCDAAVIRSLMQPGDTA